MPVQDYLSALTGTEIFKDISSVDICEMLSCVSARVKRFDKEAYIISEGEMTDAIGIVLSGYVHVIKEDFWGARAILSIAGPGEIFAASFVCSEKRSMSVSIIAAEASEVMFLDYHRMVTGCKNACPRHARMIENLLKCVSRENLELTEKLEHLTRRTTREKLLSYLSARARDAGKSRFSIPFDRQALADYLAVDRSAMSAELSRLKREGIIDFKKNRFIILGKH
ncbi:MAG: Crp/Fnr family transcriptional regulator [Oscillospiraceae bacterium]